MFYTDMPDGSDREDAILEVMEYLLEGAPLLPVDEDVVNLFMRIAASVYVYERTGYNTIIDLCQVLIDTPEEPHKTTLEFVTDSNPTPSETVFSYLQSKLT